MLIQEFFVFYSPRLWKGSAMHRPAIRRARRPRPLAAESLESRQMMTAGVLVSPLGGALLEGSARAFAFRLQDAPAADVTIPLSGSDATEASIGTAALTFTPTNWNVPQRVTVGAVEDFTVDGNQPFALATGDAFSADPRYSGLTVRDVPLTILDSRRTQAVIVTPSGGPLLEGTARQFSFRLFDAPTGTVTIDVASSDTTEGTIDRTSLVFTPQNWNVAQKVTVRGVQDFTRDGTQPLSIVTADTVSDDPRYHGRVVRDITLASIDSGRTEAFAVWPGAALVTRESDAETGRSTGFWMALTAQPAADVTVPLSSSDPDEGLPAVASLTFTPGNWRVPQRVEVAGIDDALPDGKVAYRIVTGPAVSDDPWFAGKDARDVNAVNLPWYYAGLFDGIYTGTFVGRQVSGTIDRVEIAGTSIRVDITVHGQQWESFSGTGTISSTGAFSVRTTAAGSVGGATFFGTIFADPLTRLVVGKGGWNFRNLYTGTWDIAQQPPVS